MIQHGEPPYLECSSRGDRRFSAFYARLEWWQNKSIEEIYQATKLFRLPDGTYRDSLSPKAAKLLQQQPGVQIMNMDTLRALYSYLWNTYIQENPELFDVLRAASGLSDMFGQEGHVCQATELWRIRNEDR